MKRIKCCVALFLSLVFGLSGVLQPFALYAETLDLAQEQPKVSQPANESTSSNVSADASGDQEESDSAAQDPSTPDSSEAADAESASADAATDEVSDEASDDDIEAPWLRTLGVMSTVPSAPIFLTIMAQMQISKAVQCTACLRAQRRRESM